MKTKKAITLLGLCLAWVFLISLAESMYARRLKANRYKSAEEVNSEPEEWHLYNLLNTIVPSPDPTALYDDTDLPLWILGTWENLLISDTRSFLYLHFYPDSVWLSRGLPSQRVSKPTNISYKEDGESSTSYSQKLSDLSRAFSQGELKIIHRSTPDSVCSFIIRTDTSYLEYKAYVFRDSNDKYIHMSFNSRSSPDSAFQHLYGVTKTFDPVEKRYLFP